MARKKKRSSGPTWLPKRQCWYWAPTFGGKRRHFYGTDRKEVMERALIAKANALQGRLPEDNTSTVGQWMPVWLAHKASHVAPSTLKAYTHYSTRYIIRDLGQVRLKNLKPAMVQAFYDRLSAQLTARTLSFIHGALNAALQHAVNLEVLAKNPAARTRRPKAQKFVATPLSLEGLQTFIHVNKGAWLYAATLTAFLMGLRRGEVLGLQWHDIDFRKDILSVRRSLDWHNGKLDTSAPKTASSIRDLPMPALCRQALSTHRALVAKKCLAVGHALNPSDFVFSHIDTKKPISPKALTSAYKAMLDAAGLPRIRLHDARHTTATLLIKLGEPLLAVQKLMGHKTLAITADIYIHVTALDQGKSVARLDSAIQGGIG